MNCALTLICPTYNRHDYLSRSISFWGDRDDINVIYADGSKTPLFYENTIYKNIKYYHLPEGFKERVVFLMNQVTTPYVSLICDDEYFIPSSLASCVKYLDLHSDYVACMGRAVGFSKQNDQVIFRRQYPKLNGRNLSSESVHLRLQTHFSSYVPAHCYAVTRSDVFINAMSCALEINLDVYAIFELVEEFLIASMGKTRILPYLHWLRSYEAPPIRNTGDLSLDPAKGFKQWWLSKDVCILNQQHALCSQLSLLTDGAVTYDQVVDIFDGYVKNTLSENSPLHCFKKFMISRYIRATLKDFIWQCFKIARSYWLKFSSRFRNPTIWNYFIFRELLSQGVTIDKLALTECIHSIKSS